MAANLFIQWYDNFVYQFNFDFEEFKKYGLQQFSPTKKTLNFDTNEHDFALNARNVIIFNLALNEFFNEVPKYSLGALKPIKTLLEETKDSANQDQILRLTFLTHLSKAILKPDEFESIFAVVYTIEVTNGNFYPELRKFISSLVLNKTIKQALTETINELLKKNLAHVDLENLEVVFFQSQIEGLSGFSGVNKVYIDISKINKLALKLNKIERFTTENRFNILKLNCFRVYAHEAVHVLLRSLKKDFNFSTPTLFEKEKDNKNNEDTYYDQLKLKYGTREAGYIVDKKIFNQVIDFYESSSNEKFDIQYCEEFLMKTLNNEIALFDPQKAQTIAAKLPECEMEMDFIYKKKIFNFL